MGGESPSPEGGNAPVGVGVDITEHRRAEGPSGEAQRALATLLSNLPGMAYRCRNDRDWSMEFVSEGCVELTGYQPSDLIDNRAIAYAELISPEDRSRVWDEVQEGLRDDRPFRMVYRIRTATGDDRWVWEQGRGVLADDGTLVALEGFITDISDRKRADELLELRVAERTRELATLLEVSHDVASTLELEPLLHLILDQLKTVVDYTGASILTLEGDELRIVYASGVVGPELERDAVGLRFPIRSAPAIWDAINRREPMIVDDVRADIELGRDFRRALGTRLETPPFRDIRAWMGIPLALKDRLIGMLSMSRTEPGFFTPHHARLALAIANQAAVAIENARLYRQAQAVAALEERQRLARELHDSVSQALYGIALGARTARTLLDRDPARVAEPLDYVLALAEAGLAEMRGLIFELRPESLEQEGLVAALDKQVATLRARHGITVDAALCDEPDVPLEFKEPLYRIAQEALHNTVKHARAGRVELRLACGPDDIVLDVRDDGVGFDPSGEFPGHLGLRSMRERVAALAGTVEIESAPQQGTHVRVRIPRPHGALPLDAQA